LNLSVEPQSAIGEKRTGKVRIGNDYTSAETRNAEC
jgi:hypothetical protein